MAQTHEYAQLALLVYNVNPENRIKAPLGWKENEYFPDNSVGFSYGVYEKGNEIVISYTGTNEDFTSGSFFSGDLQITADWLANIGNGTGQPTEQLKQAAWVATRIIVGNPDKTITFTGHSLGGGLASVMGVLFDKTAVVFDAAPFMPAALSPAAYGAAQKMDMREAA